MKCPVQMKVEKSCCCGSKPTAVLSRRNGADDEDSRGNFESHGGQAEVVGGGRNHRRDRPDDASLAATDQEHGYSGLWDRRKRRPSPKRVPVEKLEQVLQLFRE